jgi:hypothetical protein
VKPTAADDARSTALDGFLEESQAHGYSIETRSALQAVIVRERRLKSVRTWVGRGRAERLVVSVDEHGNVTTVAAEPRRW